MHVHTSSTQVKLCSFVTNEIHALLKVRVVVGAFILSYLTLYKILDMPHVTKVTDRILSKGSASSDLVSNGL